MLRMKNNVLHINISKFYQVQEVSNFKRIEIMNMSFVDEKHVFYWFLDYANATFIFRPVSIHGDLFSTSQYKDAP